MTFRRLTNSKFGFRMATSRGLCGLSRVRRRSSSSRLMTLLATYRGLTGAEYPFLILSGHRISHERYRRMNPNLNRLPSQKRIEARQRAAQIPVWECDQEKPYVGHGGAMRYHHPPRTTFQAVCRKARTEDLQHFTRTLKPATVERWVCYRNSQGVYTDNYVCHLVFSVVNIPLTARADYRCTDLVL